MTGPVIVGIIYSVTVIILCFLKPTAGRIFLGIFFIIMGLGVNLTFLLTNPTFVFDYGKEAWLSLYQFLTKTIIGLNPPLFGIFLILFEVTTGLFILAKKYLVKIGLIGTMVFVLLLVPTHPEQIVWAISIAGNIFLLTRNFDISLIDMIIKRLKKHKNS